VPYLHEVDEPMRSQLATFYGQIFQQKQSELSSITNLYIRILLFGNAGFAAATAAFIQSLTEKKRI
jgi:hypothetical protein